MSETDSYFTIKIVVGIIETAASLFFIGLIICVCSNLTLSGESPLWLVGVPHTRSPV
nr:hypothetical protein [uncultured Rhodopila sp.]